MTFKLVTTLPEVLIVRKLRNDCRMYLTNFQAYISIPRQVYWYFTYYRQAMHSHVYRLFILRNDENRAVGYGALHLQNKHLYITECVASKYRGQGYGKAILEHLKSIANKEKLPLIAEIWATNKISIALHTKGNFVLVKKRIKSGADINTYAQK